MLLRREGNAPEEEGKELPPCEGQGAPSLSRTGSPLLVKDREPSPCKGQGTTSRSSRTTSRSSRTTSRSSKMKPKSIPKRGRYLRATKLPLGCDLGRLWDVLGDRTRTALLLIFCRFCYYSKENNVFEKERCPRAIRERKMTKKDPKMPPKTTPRRFQNVLFWMMIFWSIFDLQENHLQELQNHLQELQHHLQELQNHL
jgi:hypothetical protein